MEYVCIILMKKIIKTRMPMKTKGAASVNAVLQRR